MSHCAVVTYFKRKGTVVSLPLQLVLIWAWFSGIHADCWTCIMHESVHMHLGHHACPCRNASTTGMQLHLACFNLFCVHDLPWNNDWGWNWPLSLDRFVVAPSGGTNQANVFGRPKENLGKGLPSGQTILAHSAMTTINPLKTPYKRRSTAARKICNLGFQFFWFSILCLFKNST